MCTTFKSCPLPQRDQHVPTSLAGQSKADYREGLRAVGIGIGEACQKIRERWVATHDYLRRGCPDSASSDRVLRAVRDRRVNAAAALEPAKSYDHEVPANDPIDYRTPK
jgi:hypothetical protein